MTHQYQRLLPDVPILIQADPSTEATEIVVNLARAVFNLEITGSEHPDLHWLNPQESLKIETVRQLQELSSFKPYSWPISLFILSQLETASLPSQQALLKILEEPPAHIRLLLFCTTSQSLLPTILSRCQLLNVESDTARNQQETNQGTAQTWYDQIQSSSYGAIVTLVDSIGEREAAQTLTNSLIKYVYRELQLNVQTDRRSQLVKQLQILVTLLEWLKVNANVKVAVEEAFFKLKQA